MSSHQTKRAILDLRGLALHAYYSDKSNAITVEGSLGEPVASAEHAVNQFIDIYLYSILQEYQPIEIIAVMEGINGNARRRRIEPSYKDKPEQDANDEIATEQKRLAQEGIARLLMHLGATMVRTPYVEADDTIAYLCERLQGDKRVYTRDKDLLALSGVNGTEVYVSDYFSGVCELRDEFEGIDLSECGPWAVTLYKSMVGDPSDNIKGVPRFGKAAFAKLLEEVEWDGMEQLSEIVDTQNWEWLEAAADGAGKPLQQLLANKEAWHNCWRLAKLHPEWCEETFAGKPVAPIWGKRVPQRENVLKELERFGLGDRIEELEEYCIAPFLMDRKWLDENQDKLEAELALMQQSQFVAFDYESYDELSNPKYREARKGFVDVLSQRITGASFAYGPNLQHSFYIPVLHRDTHNCEPSDIRELLEHNAGQNVVAHNSAFEQVLSKTNLDFTFPKLNPPLDTSDMVSYVDEESEQGLKMISKKYLNYDQTTYAQVMAGHSDMRDLSGDEVLKYGADDSIVTAHLAVLFRIIMECEGTWDFHRQNEPYFPYAMADSFIKGIPLDWEKLEELREQDAASLQEADQELRRLLTEKCSQINEEGFKTLWPEIEEYQEATIKLRARKKGAPVDADEMQSKIQAKREEVYAGCRYQTFGPPPVALSQKTLSAVARGLGLASMRANSGVKVREWAESMIQQAADQGIELTEDQSTFLVALIQAAEAVGKDQLAKAPHDLDGLQDLLEVVQQRVAGDPSQWTGTELNVGSPPQMAVLFYGMMGLPILIRNEAAEGSARDQFELEGAPATNDLAMATWLVELPEDDWRREAIELVRTIRACRQRESLYYSKYPLWASPVDGRIHPQFRNCGTETRRPSGNSPNVLQVSKNKDGGRLRSVFLPQSADRPGAEPEVIVSIDWSQEEIRLAAEVSRDPALIGCYLGDKRLDVHTYTSVGVMNILMKREPALAKLAEESGVPAPWSYDDYIKVRKDQSLPIYKRASSERDKKGKPTVFTLLYGGGAYGLARKLIVPQALGEDIYEAFFKTYPGVRKRQEQVVKTAKRQGFVQTIFGNRRHCPEILSKDKRKAGAIERQVINFEMQGAAADITKMTTREWILNEIPERTGATLYAFVYDEIVASVPVSKVHEYVNLMVDLMQITLPGTGIVLEAEASLGANWGKQIELNGDHSVENINKAIEDSLNGN